YDARGDRLTVTDQASRTTHYAYDSEGHLTQVTLPSIFDPETNQTRSPVYVYDYDTYGNQTLIRDPKGRETHFTYDEHGSQLTQTLPSIAGEPDRVETSTYTSAGLLQTHTDATGRVAVYTYDARRRIHLIQYYASQAAFQAGTVSETVTVDYDI